MNLSMGENTDTQLKSGSTLHKYTTIPPKVVSECIWIYTYIYIYMHSNHLAMQCIHTYIHLYSPFTIHYIFTVELTGMVHVNDTSYTSYHGVRFVIFFSFSLINPIFFHPSITKVNSILFAKSKSFLKNHFWKRWLQHTSFQKLVSSLMN